MLLVFIPDNSKKFSTIIAVGHQRFICGSVTTPNLFFLTGLHFGAGAKIWTTLG
jgi:hypothetical protein